MNAARFLQMPLKLLERSVARIAKKLPTWNDAAATPLYPEASFIEVTRPANFDDLPPEFADRFVPAKMVPPRRLFRLQDVMVSGRAVVFRNLQVFIPSLPWQQALEEARQPKLLLKQWWPRKQRLPQTVALIYDEWSAENYYHWMIEALPRLELLQRQLPDCPVLVPQPAPHFVTRTLEKMGTTNQVILSAHPFHVAAASQLLFPELVYYYEIQNCEVPVLKKMAAPPPEEPIVAVRKKLLQGCTPAKAPFRRIYVSRSRQKTRRLTNENAIAALLQQHGFETVYFEELKYNEQVALMQETKILAGVHGANMVNLLFLPQTAQVIELMNRDYVNDAYYLLASTLGIKYYVVPCTISAPISELDNNKMAVNDADIEVEPGLLERAIVQALAG